MEKVLVVCDLDEDDRPATNSLKISLDDTHWALDLCAEHVAKVRDILSPLLDRVAATERVSDGTSRRRPGSRRALAEERARIRDWSRERGLQVNDHGRLPREIIEAYRDAARRAG